MLRLTQRPLFINQKLGKFLFIWLLIIAAVALFFYPIGGMWLVFIPSAMPNSTTYRNCGVWGALERL
jgi:hypothetical protein